MLKRIVLALLLTNATTVHAIGIDNVTRRYQPKIPGMQIAPGERPGQVPQAARMPPQAPGIEHPADAIVQRAIDTRSRATTDALGAVFTYDGVGNRKTATYGNGVVTTYTYDRSNRLIELHTKLGETTLHRFVYTLDATGLRTHVEATETDGTSRTTDYAYDAVKRLTSETQRINGAVVFQATYGYDRVGNRTSATVNGITTAYVYDANDRLTSETIASGVNVGTTTYTYDAAGNRIGKSGAMGTVTYVYNDAGQMSEARSAGEVVGYRYSHDGLLLEKTWTPLAGAPRTWRYLWDVGRDTPQTIEEYSREDNGTEQLDATYLFGDDLIAQTRVGVTHYVLADGAGDTRALVDTGGAVTDTFTYDAWGNAIGRTGNTPATHLYRGEHVDPNLGFYYLRARWMDPTVGQFTQMDSYQGSEHAPASLHKYLYANADPVNNIDPSGHAAGGLSQQMTAVGIAAILAITAKIALDYMTRPVANNQRQFGVWDAVAVTEFRSKARADENTDALVGTLAATASREEGHHTIPVYLCGWMGQKTSRITLAQHVAIHAEIAAIRVALEGAEEYASKTIGRHRTSEILRIAQTRHGREAITGALQEVYRWGGWLDKGEPRTIGTVFGEARPKFESGAETSLPWCTRRGGPDQ